MDKPTERKKFPQKSNKNVTKGREIFFGILRAKVSVTLNRRETVQMKGIKNREKDTINDAQNTGFRVKTNPDMAKNVCIRIYTQKISLIPTTPFKPEDFCILMLLSVSLSLFFLIFYPACTQKNILPVFFLRVMKALQIPF